jgi:hypothetical protein
MSATIAVLDQDRPIGFSFEDMLDYHGPGSPAGVAHAFKVLELTLPLLDDGAPPQRREITIATAFGGPGARDAFELVTRAVSDDRYAVDPALAVPERGRARERFVFTLEYRGTSVTVACREGFVTDEFIDLARKQVRSGDEERQFAALKLELAELVMSAEAGEVYELLTR